MFHAQNGIGEYTDLTRKALLNPSIHSGRGRLLWFCRRQRITRPELNTYALRKLRPQLTKAGIGIGYSNSRTCEIGLATNTGIPYVSIAYLVDQCTRPIKQENNLTLK